MRGKATGSGDSNNKDSSKKGTELFSKIFDSEVCRAVSMEVWPNRCLTIKHLRHISGAVFKRFSGDVQFVHDADEHVAQRCLAGVLDELFVGDAEIVSTGQDQRVVVIDVCAAVAAAIEHDGPVQHAATVLLHGV